VESALILQIQSQVLHYAYHTHHVKISKELLGAYMRDTMVLQFLLLPIQL